MNIPCRITDENVNNPWEDDLTSLTSNLNTQLMGLNEVTIDDLMSTGTYVWVSRNNASGFILELEDQNSEEPFLKEAYLQRHAMENLAGFCRRFLNFYEKVA